MITNASNVGIYAGNQDRALDFWTNKMGFKLIQDTPMSETARWIEVAPEGASVKFVLFTPDEQRDRIGTFSNIVFTCDDLQKTYEELTARGVEFTEAPRQEFWGWWSMFKDCNGNTYGLGQS